MKIAPSLLSCDFSKMGEEIERMDLAGADWMHLDVMDGHFVPNITFGAPVIKAVRKFSNRPFDVHLMISDPLKYIDDFADAGADIITFHVECDSDIDDTIAKIKSRGIKPGLVLKPNTPAWTVFPYLEKLDLRHHLGHKALSAKARFNRHNKYKVKLFKIRKYCPGRSVWL